MAYTSRLALFFLASSLAVAPLARADIRPSDELPPAKSTHESLPPAPSPLADHDTSVHQQAGVGSTVAYGRNGVLELGGSLSFSSANSGLMLAATPSIGWFFADNFELSGLVGVQYARVNTKDYTLFVTALVEPSAHIPVSDGLFVFGGLGVGAAYDTKYTTAGLALAPRAGLNVMVGRSGILTPSISVNLSSNGTTKSTSDAGTLVAMNTSWGANIGYTVMW